MANGRIAPAAHRSFVQRLHQFAEGVRAMADAVLELGVELAERFVIADRHEHWIITKAFVAAWRPDKSTVDAAFERLRLAVVGPCDSKRAGEVCIMPCFGSGSFGLTP